MFNLIYNKINSIKEMRNKIPMIKRLSRSQSENLLENKTLEEKNIMPFVEKKMEDFVNVKKSLITSITSRKKILLPKINIFNRPKFNSGKKETFDDILNKFNKVGPFPEESKNISKLKEYNFLFGKNIKLMNSRNRLKKITIKKNLSTIEEIKRRNREIRRKKEKLENELFEMRQRKATKLMASFKVELDGNNKMRRKVGKRYTLFKEILIYLESNNITLDQMAKNDPFQHKAYMLPNSYEFFNAVKFKNYNYVIKALNTDTNYLFSIDYFGQTAYHWAAKLDDLKMLKILIDYGLYLNQKDYKGRTPLYIAAMNNHKEICTYLLSKGGNIFLKDKEGLSPLDAAGSPEMKSYLSEFISQPFSNPLYKERLKKLLLDREEKVNKKNAEKEKEKMKKNKIDNNIDDNKGLNNIDEEYKNEDNK